MKQLLFALIVLVLVGLILSSGWLVGALLVLVLVLVLVIAVLLVFPAWLRTIYQAVMNLPLPAWAKLVVLIFVVLLLGRLVGFG